MWNPNPANFIAHVETQLVTKGTAQAYPKYGFFCNYDDSNNHAEMFVDPVYMVLATHAVVGGSDSGWQNTNLPSGFSPTAWHALDCTRAAPTTPLPLIKEPAPPSARPVP